MVEKGDPWVAKDERMLRAAARVHPVRAGNAGRDEKKSRGLADRDSNRGERV